MSSKWPVARLGEVADIHNGGTPRTGVADYWDGGLLWVTPAEMGKLSSPYLGSTARTLSPDGMKASNTKMMPANSVIMSSRAPIGHLVINTEPMSFNQGCKGLIPNDRLDHKYLYYFLLSSKDYLNSLGSGTTFAELSAGKLKEVEIPLPPLDEQKRIVAKLDQALDHVDQLGRATQSSLQELDALWKSALNEAFNPNNSQNQRTPVSEDWPVVRLDTVATIGAGNSAPQNKDAFCDDGELFIRTSDVGQIKFGEIHTSADKLTEAASRGFRRFRAGTVLIPKSGASTFNNHRVITKSEACVSSHLATVTGIQNKVEDRYLWYFLQTVSAQDLIQDQAYPSLSLKQISEIATPSPPLDEQKRIVTKLDAIKAEIEVLKNLKTASQSELLAMRSSILSAAFEGNL